MISRAQGMAQRAWNCVSRCAETNQGREEYLRLSRTFPTLIHISGLCQAVTFYQAKQHDHYLQDLALVLGRPDARSFDWGLVRSAPLAEYRRLTLDVMSSALWLKRFAEAELSPSADDNGGDARVESAD